MDIALDFAGWVLIFVGLAHSYLGERYILIRLFRRDNIPKLFGDTDFTKKTLRFAWHITSIAWWGFAAIIFQLANRSISIKNIAFIIGITFIITGLVALIASKAKHLSWPFFFFIGFICFYAVMKF